MVNLALFDAFRLGNLYEISFAVLKDQAVAPATTQAVCTIDILDERTFTANLRHHLVVLVFRNLEGVARIGIDALPFWQSRFSLRKKTHVIFTKLHKDTIHVGRIFSLQRSRPEHAEERRYAQHESCLYEAW